MLLRSFIGLGLLLAGLLWGWQELPQMQAQAPSPLYNDSIQVAAERLDLYLPSLKNKRLALLVNHTSMVGNRHLVDVLLERGMQIQKIFAPEHGFRGQADAGAVLKDGRDAQTGLPIVSLYGRNKQPSAEQLADVDVVIFDIQDVGARFYTYISSMTYMMQACAENDKTLLILDRPNPNGHYIAGPILDTAQYRSFVGLHPVPIVHGMTVAEYARMVNGEYWLRDSLQCRLRYIPCKNYSHKDFYELPVRPSPNLPNMRSIYLYPSICLFEASTVSVGRGTLQQFQVLGHPDFPDTSFAFTPIPRAGASRPKHQDQRCYGWDLSALPIRSLQRRGLDWSWLFDFYQKLPASSDFFLRGKGFERLGGTEALREALLEGKDWRKLRKSWQSDLWAFQKVRKKYLLYEDF